MEIGSLSPIAPELSQGPEKLQETKLAPILLGVVSHNSSKGVARLFASLKDQAAEFEVLVVDNASRPEELESLRQLCFDQDFSVRIVERERNNLGAARNDIYKAATNYEYLAYCDSDVELPAGWLKSARLKLHENQTLTAISGPAHIPQQTSVWARVLKDLSSSYLMNMGSAQNVRVAKDVNLDHLPCSAVLFHRSKLKSDKLFNERLAEAGEDLELGLRLTAEDHKLGFEDDLGFLHHTRIANLKEWTERCYKLGVGRIQVMRLQPEQRRSKAILLPLAFGLYLFVCALTVLVSPIAGLGLLAVYVLPLAILSFLRAGSYGPEAFLMMAGTHAAYSYGQWSELLNPWIKGRDSGKFSLRKDAFSHGQILSKIQLCELLEAAYVKDEQKFKRVYVLAGWAGLLPFIMRTKMNDFFEQIILVDRDAKVCEQARKVNNILECESRFQVRCEDVTKFDFAAENLGPEDLIINTSMEHFEDWSWIKKIPQATHLALQASDLPHQEHVSLISTVQDFKERLARDRVEVLERKTDELLIEYPDLSYKRVTLIGPRWGLS